MRTLIMSSGVGNAKVYIKQERAALLPVMIAVDSDSGDDTNSSFRVFEKHHTRESLTDLDPVWSAEQFCM